MKSMRFGSFLFFFLFFFFFLFLTAIAGFAYQTPDYEVIGYKVANSIVNKMPSKIKTIAIWDFNNYASNTIYLGELRDSLEIAIVKRHKFQLIDRTKLQLILKEQSLSLTGLIDPQQIKKLGKLYGIDALLFCDLLENDVGISPNITILAKAIDTETGRLIYSEEIPLESNYLETCVYEVSEDFLISINKDSNYIKKHKIKTIAFWVVNDDGKDGKAMVGTLSPFPGEARVGTLPPFPGDEPEVMPQPSSIDSRIFINKFTNLLVNKSQFDVVDRDNLRELLKEQTVGATGLFDPKTTKRIGRLYGVDAFIYGTIKEYSFKKDGNKYVGNIDIALKMIDVNTAQLLWGEEEDAVFSKSDNEIRTALDLKAPRANWVPVLQSAVIPGWGQRTKGQVKKANTMLGWFIIGAGSSLYANSQYSVSFQNYMNASSQSAMDNYYGQANSWYQIKQGCDYLTLYVWLWNVWDAATNQEVEESSTSIYFVPGKDSFMLGANIKL